MRVYFPWIRVRFPEDGGVPQDLAKPRDEDIDVFGTTHVGRARKVNEDNFLVCSLHKTMRIRATSLSEDIMPARRDERLGYLAVVADGLGGLAHGERASRVAVETVARYATHCMDCFYEANPRQEEQFLLHLKGAAQACHRAVMSEVDARRPEDRMATTLTLLLTVWPRMYVVQVGDSRCYVLQGGELRRVTKDQTLAQDLVDEGTLSVEDAERSRFSHILSSAIGAAELTPVTSSLAFQPDDLILLCTDGLTRHVTDAEIEEHLRSSTRAEETVNQLVDLALERGGLDNITVVVGGARSPRS